MSVPAINSRVRAVWNAMLFWLVAELALMPLLNPALGSLARAWHLRNDLSAATVALLMYPLFIAAFVYVALRFPASR
jgi:hypothetical protein